MATAYVLLPVNTFSTAVAVWWSITNWNEFIRNRGYWSWWPLFWMAGSVVLFVLQLLLSMPPSWLTKRRRSTVPAWLRRAVILSASVGVLVTVGGVAAIFLYNATAPKVHAVGM